ncbi:Peptidase M48, Ste24p [Candidatus Sulfotelmatobacter kueseliae]|uniref:Peptidase M48, Ste24p n=1 Tax=Candidatus Sulfotelmatobacter kueseliae TaxID=2042962 RepID=A0A2U3K833_9BACT|nr:Peptidase M48, Ste24p [Candidatus Sulfotelmatobacter kueseliae]
MRTWNSVLTAVLLGMFFIGSMSAAAQQAADSQPLPQPPAPDAAQRAQPAQPAAPAAQPAPSAQPAPAPAPQPAAEPVPATPAPTTMDQVVNLFIEREHGLIKMLSNRTPVVETYLQNLASDAQLGPVPSEDHYFLGRMDMGETVDRKDYLKDEESKSMQTRLLGGFEKLYKVQYQPLGFSWMVYADRTDFDREHYDFRYVRREFLGEVRCLVFDVTPKKNSGRGRFLGRIWVEDQNFNIVRLNGTYYPAPRNSYFFHMDSWRLNLIPGYWVPAYIYSEEGDFSAGVKNKMAFKAQTRIWGYDLKKGSKDDELTQIRVDSVKDDSPTAQDASPLQAERVWQQQAEDNVVERLTEAGLLAPEGDVDHILQTVVNNLEVTNNIDLPRPVRTRVLLTAPLETFSVGNTIVISRGLIDVLPDEASLAAVLSHELAHIVLGHNLGSKYAFNDRMLFSDDATYQNLGFKHIPEEEQAADKKALELLKNSPYAQKLDNVGLFLKALQARATQLNALLTTHLGNPLTEGGQITRLSALSTQGPALDNNKLDQIAALPLGGRVKINPWDDKAEMVKTAPVAITSARDKMPFEVTPFFPRLTRYGTTAPAAAPTTTATNSNAGN